MQLGYVTAIIPEYSLEEHFALAAEIGYECVEVMCWPPGKAERRYAGVTHLDVAALDEAGVAHVRELQQHYGVRISALGYYPNPLVADREEGQVYIDHLYQLLDAASLLGVGSVTTFVGRDPLRTIDEQWDRFLEVWQPLVAHAEKRGVRIGVENCPMRFTKDEWPGGKNLAVSPAVWERMWRDIPSANWGLNYDPSHLVLQHMDYTLPFRMYPDRMVHVHAKDARIDVEARDHHGVFSHPNLWHTPKIPGLGDVDWGQFIGHLRETGYDGAVCVEVEDRTFEGSLEKRIASLRQSYNYLRPFIS
ncbi:sugar phosphate isomerase/epimerase [Lewinella sp. 4G2]|uniref:sugar phosphate isomerase/epimerase family protein n=1 Tax=Lewinella sp. 4G2 TaxID=1803372 RepID=UPI0007B4830D|nr:sugar phosphate isomerase/epimerase family protein [Lewinella sp. 4G2]OAV43901.1 AP endonuclease [Lewinella sp. 4G2]